MIYLVTNHFSPRIEYIANLVFDQILGADFHLTEPGEAKLLPESAMIINYSGTNIEHALSIPNCGLLEEDHIRSQEPDLTWNNSIPLLFPDERKGFDLSFDILSACFYLATGYAYYQIDQYDEHGRYDENALFTYRHQLTLYPWVHHFCDWLASVLKDHAGEIFLNPTQADYEITWDIDNPWFFKNKPFKNKLGSIFKQLIKGKPGALKERIDVLRNGKQDPYSTYEQIIDYSPKSRTTLFFLINGQSRFDSTFDLNNPAYVSLIHCLAKEGYSIGIHPSYDTVNNPDLILKEKSALEQTLNQPVHQSRQHYLKFHMPDTFEVLEKAGITEDYTLCPIQQGGFLLGMAKPFEWFNLRQNALSNLTIKPTMVMDRTLQKYLALNPMEGSQYLETLWQTTYKVGGKFIILLHNEALSNKWEWEGWQPIFQDFLAKLNQ